MTKTIKTLILCVIACLITSTAFAEPIFQASLAPGIALHNRNQRIEGFTLSLWGENPQTSLALGIINGTDRNSGGVSLGFINYGDVYSGVQLGFLNADRDLHGAQVGVLNIANGKKTGFQFGLFNVITTNKEWFSNFPNELAPFMLFINWRLEK
jgi:hypothetical protein